MQDGNTLILITLLYHLHLPSLWQAREGAFLIKVLFISADCWYGTEMYLVPFTLMSNPWKEHKDWDDELSYSVCESPHCQAMCGCLYYCTLVTFCTWWNGDIEDNIW